MASTSRPPSVVCDGDARTAQDVPTPRFATPRVSAATPSPSNSSVAAAATPSPPISAPFVLRKLHVACFLLYTFVLVLLPWTSISPLIVLTLRIDDGLPLLRASVATHIALIAALVLGAAARLAPRADASKAERALWAPEVSLTLLLGPVRLARLGLALRALHAIALVWIFLSLSWILRAPYLRSLTPFYHQSPTSRPYLKRAAAMSQGGTHVARGLSLAAVAAAAAEVEEEDGGAGAGAGADADAGVWGARHSSLRALSKLSLPTPAAALAGTHSRRAAPRIAIATVAEGLPQAKTDQLVSLMEAYTARHGYDFVEGMRYFGPTRGRDWRDWEPSLDTTHSRFAKVHKSWKVWCKLPLLWNLSHHYDLVAWFDLDAVVTNPARRLEDALGPLEAQGGLTVDPQLWIAEDLYHAPGGPLESGGTIHAGVFVVRGSPWTRDLLQTILSDDSMGEPMLAEQHFINEAIFAGRPRYAHLEAYRRTVLVPYFSFNSPPNSFLLWERWLHADFVAHNMGDKWKAERLEALLEWMRGEGWCFGLFMRPWTYVM
jgi:hypothetical protein